MAEPMDIDSSRRSKRKRNDATESKSLIDVIKYQPTKLIPKAVRDWVERYDSEPFSALQELLIAMFEACGVQYSFKQTSIDKIDIDDVVLELVIQAKDGNLEDYLSSKQRELRGFRENLLAFWDSFVRECQNGPLFDQELTNTCIGFITALACSPPRIFRIVATLIGLQFITSFALVAKTLGQSRETTQRQLNAEQKKRKDGRRVESLNKVLSETHTKITKVEELIKSIYQGLFVHRYRDIDPDIRASCIRSLGSWIISYPSLFMDDRYIKYLGWTLSDKNATVRKSSIEALQALCETNNASSIRIFAVRFAPRMIELADDIDASVAVSGIGLLKQLLRHQLIQSEAVGPLYDLLLDESPQIRHAVGQLVYEQMIAPKDDAASPERGEGSELELKKLLRILKEFSNDPILCDYMIDSIWDVMKAMQDWKCLTSMILDDDPSMELTDEDTTNLCRILCGSVKKSVGEKMLPSVDGGRKTNLSKAHKESLESNRKKMTTVMIKTHSKLLRKYLVDTTKVAYIVEIIPHMKLELYGLKQQEQNCVSSLELTKDAFFKHGDERTLKSCVSALAFCVNQSQADLQDAAQRIFKETIDELTQKLREAVKHAGETEDEYSLTVNLRRLQQLQLTVCIANDSIFKDMVELLEEFSNLEDEVVQLVVLNMFLHVVWCLKGMDGENPDDALVDSLVSKRDMLLKHLDVCTDNCIECYSQNQLRNQLVCTVCGIQSDVWSLFSKVKLSGTKLGSLGFCPSSESLKKFWHLCEHRLSLPDDEEDREEEEEEEENENRKPADYLNQKDVLIAAAAKLIVHDMVPKEYLGPQVVSHYVMHGKGVEETVKQLIVILRKSMKSPELCNLFLEAMKRAYERFMEETPEDDDENLTKSDAFIACKDLASKLSATFSGIARNTHRPNILKLVKEGVEFAFEECPKKLPFLEACVVHFSQRLPVADIREVIENLQSRVKDIDTDEDPNGWRPYVRFVEHLQERVAKTGAAAGGGNKHGSSRSARRSKNLRGKKLFEGEDDDGESEEDEIEEDEEEEEDEDEQPAQQRQRQEREDVVVDDDGDDDDDVEDDDETPLFQVRRSIIENRSSNAARKPSVHQNVATEEHLPGL